MPKRIQLRRTAGWKKPEGAVVVARPTKWGNPFVIGDLSIRDAQDAVSRFRVWLANSAEGRALAERAKEELRGRDLACWCPPGQPCHADVLLELANAPESGSAGCAS